MSPQKTKSNNSTILEVFEAQRITSTLWRDEPVQARIKRLEEIQKWILAHRLDIQKALFKDFKKPASEVDLTETYVVLTELKHTISHLRQWVKPIKVETPIALIGSQSSVRYEPKGVTLIISPWNFPLNLSIAPMVSAIAAGNTVILKPSELTPNCTKLLTSMVKEIFNPSEVAIFSGDKSVAQELLKLPFDHIFFTGSPTVGKIVMKSAAEHLSSVTLELGGKSPAIIDDTVDLKDAAEKVCWGKFMNCGQTCIAPDYILIDKSVQDEFLDELRLAIDRLFDSEGIGVENSPDYARIINDHHFDRLNNLLADALDLGATLEAGGLVNEQECYIAPTVMSDVPDGAEVLEHEIFGPILPILNFDELAEAVDYINSKPKPLALYLFSKSSDNRELVLAKTSSGSVAINDCVIQFMNPYLPFGGINSSGFGKSHGHQGFKAFSNMKSVLKQKIGLTSIKPVYPPYTAIAKNAIDLLLKYF